MAPVRDKVIEELGEFVRGELLFDDLSRALYSTDASIYQVQPFGVIAPRDEADVQAIVRYAAEHDLSITGRGAGSGLAGESLSTGLILDFSPHFRDILEIGSDTVRVQPGVVYRDLSAQLAKVGRRLAPDPASGAQCTLGGMLANNASGARALKYGYTRDYVLHLNAVLDTGEAAAFARVPRNGAETKTREGQILAALTPLLEQNAELIRACQPRTPFNRCGYLLHDVLTPAGLDVAKLLVGTEGTLALFTEATLRTIPLPAERGLVLLGFASLEAAARAVPRCLAAGPSACELLDRRLLTLTRDAYPEYGAVVPAATEAVLLVEFESESTGDARPLADALLRQFEEREPIVQGVSAENDEQVDWLWRLRDLSLPMLYGLPGKAQPMAFIEDVGVPAEALFPYLHRVQDILQRHQTTASFLIHAGAGQVHTRPFLDLRKPENVQRLRAIANEVYQLALDLGGTISTQHAVGLARTPWMPQQYGRLFQVFRDIKAIFDPNNLFNPGKIVGSEGDLLTSQLRKECVSDKLEPELRLRWEKHEVATQCHACNGCGSCRTEAPAQRMCPLFRVDHDEAASPRAKANLLRSLLDGTLTPEQLGSNEVLAVADLCINCKMCAVECPAHVNIPKLMLETKAQHVAEHGLGYRDWAVSRTDSLAALGSTFAPLFNALLRKSSVRWLLERLFGISRHRRLPPFARDHFFKLAAQRGWTRPPRARNGPRVAYFVDTYAAYNDPSIALATVAVLHHNGVEVYVPPRQVGCGMAPLAYGDVDRTRQMAERNMRVFADLARAGFTIVCSEPTAALMLRHDYADLVEDPDTRLVAGQTRELMTYLAELHVRGRLRTDFRPLDFSVGHHVPCHLKALQQGVAGPGLLSLIPLLRGHTIDVSCSGMAGTFGVKAENFDASLAAGKPMLDRLRQEDLHFGASECSPCRMQMEQGAGKRCLHPVQYLALAYGLMPELEQRLREPIGELVLR